MPITLQNVPLLPQSDRADCLPACVQMVLAFHGQDVEQAWLKSVMETTELGTPGFKVLNLQQHGYAVTYAAATDARVLSQALSDGVPPIALVHTAALPYWHQETAHAVVIVGMDTESVTVHDPVHSATPQTVSREVYMLAWSDFDYLYALVYPAGVLPAASLHPLL